MDLATLEDLVEAAARLAHMVYFEHDVDWRDVHYKNRLVVRLRPEGDLEEVALGLAGKCLVRIVDDSLELIDPNLGDLTGLRGSITVEHWVRYASDDYGDYKASDLVSFYASGYLKVSSVELEVVRVLDVEIDPDSLSEWMESLGEELMGVISYKIFGREETLVTALLIALKEESGSYILDNGTSNLLDLARVAPSEVLRKLAEDEDPWVRLAVARNTNTPPDVLRKLAEDEDWEVRRAVASNPSAPPEALLGLAMDPQEDVRMAVLRNPNAPREAHARMMVE